MYQLDVIKQSKLVKQMGGPPIFHDGFVHTISINKNMMVLDIKILSQNNPLLTKDTHVLLKLYQLHSFHLSSEIVENCLLVIHDIDIKKYAGHLHLILESATGEKSDVIFESIELEPAQ